MIVSVVSQNSDYVPDIVCLTFLSYKSTLIDNVFTIT